MSLYYTEEEASDLSEHLTIAHNGVTRRFEVDDEIRRRFIRQVQRLSIDVVTTYMKEQQILKLAYVPPPLQLAFVEYLEKQE